MALEEKDRALIQRVLAQPLEYPEAFKAWFPDWLAMNIPKLPISQVFGFKIDQAKVATEITTAQAVTASSYVDLATPGPSLTGLHNGIYIVMFGARISTYAGTPTTHTGRMSLSLNGSVPTDDDSAIGALNPIFRTVMVEIRSKDNNSIVAKYKRGDGTVTSCTLERRFMAAMRVVDADA